MSDSILSTQTDGVEWPDFVPEELRTEENKPLAKYKSEADVLKAYTSLERKLGAMISIPGENATQDDWQKYEKKIGVPETADGYEFTLPEGSNEDLVAKIRIAGKKHRVPASALRGVVEEVFSDLNNQSQEQVKAAEARAQEWSDLTAKTFGEEFDTMKGAIQRHLKSGLPGLDEKTVEILEQTGLAHNPAIVRAFYADAKVYGESAGKFPDGQGSGGLGNEASTLKKEIETLVKDPAYFDRWNPNHRQVVERHNTLAKRLSELG